MYKELDDLQDVLLYFLKKKEVETIGSAAAVAENDANQGTFQLKIPERNKSVR